MKKTSFLLLLLLPVAQIFGQVETSVHINKYQGKGLFISETPSVVKDTFRILSIQLLNKKEHSCEDSKWNETYIIHVENKDGIFVLLSPSTFGITNYENEIKVSDSCLLEIKPYNNHDFYPKHGISASFFIHEVCYKLDYGELWFQNIYTTDNLDGLHLVTDSKNKGNCEILGTGYKIGTNYIIQEVVYGYPEFYPPFACCLRLKTDYDLYYVTDEDFLINAITADSINLDSLTYLVPHYSNWDIFDSVQNKYVHRVCFSQHLDNLMTMDNTEVYKIGGKYYAIKKIRYAYLDNIEVYRSLYNIVRDGTDDIQIEDEEEEYYRTTYKTIKKYLPNSKYQYYLFLLDICETDKAIKEHLWKRKYELNDFWTPTTP